jgi:hypothetical protein
MGGGGSGNRWAAADSTRNAAQGAWHLVPPFCAQGAWHLEPRHLEPPLSP